MIDVLFLAHGRPEFTTESLKALLAHTDWTTARLVIYTVGERLSFPVPSVTIEVNETAYGGPVAIMTHYVSTMGPEIFAKIDNDVIVPPHWLKSALAVMKANSGLDLLGIEPPMSRTPAPGFSMRMPAPDGDPVNVTLAERAGTSHYARCDAIGGIGLMRRRAFETRAAMRPHGTYHGFTDWQLAHADLCKGWIVPPLKVFLLDRLPIEPWASLSREYITMGRQRPWTNYSAADGDLWSWWQPEEQACEDLMSR